MNTKQEADRAKAQTEPYSYLQRTGRREFIERADRFAEIVHVPKTDRYGLWFGYVGGYSFYHGDASTRDEAHERCERWLGGES